MIIIKVLSNPNQFNSLNNHKIHIFSPVVTGHKVFFRSFRLLLEDAHDNRIGKRFILFLLELV